MEAWRWCIANACVFVCNSGNPPKWEVQTPGFHAPEMLKDLLNIFPNSHFNYFLTSFPESHTECIYIALELINAMFSSLDASECKTQYEDLKIISRGIHV